MKITRTLLQASRTDPSGQEMALKKTGKSELDVSGSTLSTYVEESEELQARAEGTTGRRKAKGAELKRVSFGTLEVRLYPITLGDNPACSHGPPITVEWDYTIKRTMPVNLWESNRPSRRQGDELRTEWLFRRRLLEGEVSGKEIAEINKELFKTQKRRIQTIDRMKYEKIEIFTESLCRKAKRAFTRSPKISVHPTGTVTKILNN